MNTQEEKKVDKTPYKVLQTEGTPLEELHISNENIDGVYFNVLTVEYHGPSDRFPHRIRVFESDGSEEFPNMYVDTGKMSGWTTEPVETVMKNHNNLSSGIVELINKVNQFLLDKGSKPDWY